MPEQIPIGADHAGFHLKERLKQELESLGYDVMDLGTRLLCGTGLGMAVSANRHQGVRAGVAWTPEIARLSRRHNDTNVLVLPARFVSEEEGLEILRTWLDTPFEGGRHSRRVNKMEPEHA